MNSKATIRAKRILGLLSGLLLLAQGPPAHSELVAVGPVDPQNGFPVWYQDPNGMTLQLCLDGNGGLEFGLGPCAFDPPILGNPWSEQTGFGEEAFWFVSDSIIPLPGGGLAILVLALEAAYSAGPPADGDQFPFSRVRIRVDAPVPGTYKVIHPYGVELFENADAGLRSINLSRDIGSFAPDFTAALKGDIGPFLVSESFKPGDPYIGDPNLEARVTGSPFGTNFFRIEGPPDAFPDKITDEAGVVVGSFIQNDLFTVMGKVFTGKPPTPLTVVRSTYSRDALGGIEIGVYAVSAPAARLEATVSTVTVLMVGDGTGLFVAHVPLPAGATRPALVSVTATDTASNAAPSTVFSTLVDLVTAETPLYDVGSGSLSITASSSDQASSPLLTAEGFGPLTDGSLDVLDLIVPPPTVTVSSSEGGSDTEAVRLANPSGNSPPIALDDLAETDATNGVLPLTIDVVANDFDADGLVDPASVVIVVEPEAGTALANGDGSVTYTPAASVPGVDRFGYVVRDDGGAVSNVATVSVTILGVNDPPTAFPDSAQTFMNEPVLVQVLANDSDVNGNPTIDPSSVTITQAPPFGSALVNTADGSVTFTPGLGFVGTDSFKYTVADLQGAVSNQATVLVSVLPKIQEVITVNQAQYEAKKNKWRIRGVVAPIMPGTEITVFLVSGATQTPLGTTQEDPADGTWRLEGTLGAGATTGDQIKVETSNGGVRFQTVTVK